MAMTNRNTNSFNLGEDVARGSHSILGRSSQRLVQSLYEPILPDVGALPRNLPVENATSFERSLRVGSHLSVIANRKKRTEYSTWYPSAEPYDRCQPTPGLWYRSVFVLCLGNLISLF
jgi:hypothetical protein